MIFIGLLVVCLDQVLTFAILFLSYCMRIQLDKVPDSDWVCEDCVLSEDKEKRRPTKFSSFVTSPKYNKNELDQEVETSGATSLKVNPVSGSKGLDIDKNRRDKLSCLPSSKRPLSSVHSALLMRRRARGLTNILTSTKQSKAPSSRDFAKSNEELSSSKDLSARSTRENTELLSVSSQSLSKSRQLPTSSGICPLHHKFFKVSFFIQKLDALQHFERNSLFVDMENQIHNL